jgi:argininosuccinate synthase
MTDTHARAGIGRIVLAYSGGVATSIAIPWLADHYGAEIIAVTMDLGQGKDFLQEVRDRALATGALRAHVVDVRDEFARDYLVRALKADLVAPDRSPGAAALARPLIARTLVAIAEIEQARAVAHGDRNDAGRAFPASARPGDSERVALRDSAAPLETMIRDLDPTLTVLSPAVDWGMDASEQVAYARLRHVALPASIASSPDDRSAQPRPAAGVREEAACVEITIERGVPVAVNGVVMPLLDLVGSLDIIAGAHGVGRMAALHAAHRALQHATVPGDVESFSTLVAQQYLRILRDGSWFGPMRPALDAYVDRIQDRVTGVVRLKLLNGDCAVVDCQVPSASPRLIAVTKS